MVPDALRDHPVAAFVAVAYGFSWAWWVGGGLLFGGRTVAFTAVQIVGSFGPAVAAALLASTVGPGLRSWARGLFRVRVPLRWYAAAIGVPLLVPVGVTAWWAARGGTLDLSLVPGRLVRYLFGFVFVALVGGGNEEPGWRGWMLPKLQETYGALTSAVAVGLAWAAWHAPLFVFSPAYAGRPPVAYAAFVVAASVVFAWLYNGSGSVVPVAVLLHVGVNTATVLAPVPRTAMQSPGFSQAGLYVQLGVWTLVALAAVAVHGRETLAAGAARVVPTADAGG
ncbi:CPBP family intramembrane glutamic endopeptidase [Halorarius halobius]|uniref:CPBP family intramembrane glutamic endopeptidase n=1 Tax=Halorarius halobius TaxID=2962671 RepID=UPI0020CDB114|nr:CPBP family intramembrane glutamic endopeptidase [Halorarius halobius]